MKFRSTFTLLLFLGAYTYPFICISQEDLKVSGRVIDQKTKMPLPFANVSIKDKSDGTVTNFDGEFDIFISSHVSDTLIISHVGYTSFLISIKDAQNGALLIELNERTLELNEVQIQAERLVPRQIMESVLDKLKDNYASEPFISKGFFRDLRNQNNESAYLVEASFEVLNPGVQIGKSYRNERRKNFYLNAVRASKNYINGLLTPVLDRQNWLALSLAYDFWIRRLRSDLLDLEKEYELQNVVYKNNTPLYVIVTVDTTAKSYLAEQHKHMRYEYTKRYYIDIETYAVHKIEKSERPIEGIYVGIEKPYPGDTLYYSKKGWNHTYEFEEFADKMYLRYYDLSYAFDIVNSKTSSVYLDMEYSNTLVITTIDTSKRRKIRGAKMNRNKSLALQVTKYNPTFWNKQSNTKLVPLTQKQIDGLEREMDLEEQFMKSANTKNK